MSIVETASQTAAAVTNSVLSVANEPAVWITFLAAVVISSDPSLATAIVTAVTNPMLKVKFLGIFVTIIKSHTVFLKSLVVMSPVIAVSSKRHRNMMMLGVVAISAFSIPSLYTSIVASMSYRVALRVRSDMVKVLIFAVAVMLIAGSSEDSSRTATYMSMENIIGPGKYERIRECRDSCGNSSDDYCVPCCVHPWLIVCRDQDNNKKLNGTTYVQWCKAMCYGMDESACSDCCDQQDPRSPPCV